ncbi:MAG: metallopeptidase family protein [Candidatus Nealsonbacteria bacterium]
MNQEKFKTLVEKALEELPKNIQKAMDNVAVVIEDFPSKDDLKKTGTSIEGNLLGLYQGVPKTAWGRGFGMQLPDKITIFQNPIENFSSSFEEIQELVKIVVWHEIAHHFGFNEKKVRELEKKWRKY